MKLVTSKAGDLLSRGYANPLRVLTNLENINCALNSLILHVVFLVQFILL